MRPLIFLQKLFILTEKAGKGLLFSLAKMLTIHKNRIILFINNGKV